MKRLVLIYGAIAGVIVSAWMVGSIAAGAEHMDSNWGMILGFTAMIIGFSFIFVAIKKYREHYGNGGITFGKAFKIGLLIALIGSTIYVAAWMVDYYFFIPDFMEKYAAQYLENMKADGATAAEISKAAADMEWYREMYKNPVFVALLTYTEILPLGLVISLIAAAILQRKPQTPMTA